MRQFAAFALQGKQTRPWVHLQSETAQIVQEAQLATKTDQQFALLAWQAQFQESHRPNVCCAKQENLVHQMHQHHAHNAIVASFLSKDLRFVKAAFQAKHLPHLEHLTNLVWTASRGILPIPMEHAPALSALQGSTSLLQPKKHVWTAKQALGVHWPMQYAPPVPLESKHPHHRARNAQPVLVDTLRLKVPHPACRAAVARGLMVALPSVFHARPEHLHQPNQHHAPFVMLAPLLTKVLKPVRTAPQANR